MTRIYAFHLLNDYSGSPKVLGQLLKDWANQFHVHLYTSNANPGFLTDITGIIHHPNYYRFYPFIPLRLLILMLSQLLTCCSLLFKLKKEDVVYVNTILPFGAAIAGKIKGVRVIYHIHETSVNPKIFKAFLLFWVKTCASEVVYVSNFLAAKEPLGKPSHILWNAIENDFKNRAEAKRKTSWKFDNVLMLASLKKYKGVDEFVEIAKACPELHFDLVANASSEDISTYFDQQKLPDNLTIYPAQRDVHPFYQRADVVMNLSRPDEWQETFGLTALEGMVYGLPVIVPPVGGIAEVVKDGLTGFHINGKDTDSIVACLRRLYAQPSHYQDLSRRAAQHAGGFSESSFLDRSIGMIRKENFPPTGTIFQNME